MASTYKFLLLLLRIAGMVLLNATAGARAAGREQKFAMEPQDQTAVVGSRVTLPCRVIDKSGILQWTKDDFGLGTHRNLSGFERYSMIGSDEEGDFSLDIYPVMLDDDAKYQCQVSPGPQGQPGIRSHFAVVTVLVPPDPPKIVQGDYLVTTEDREIELECISHGGKPAAEITWIDGLGNVLTDGIEYIVEELSDGRRFTAKSILKLTPRKDHHNTTFTCQAQNTAERTHRSAKLKLEVKYAPKVTVSILSGATQNSRIPEGSEVRLGCHADANPSDVTYKWFLNDEALVGDYTTELIIHNATRRHHDAIVKCEVHNAVGKSEESETLDISSLLIIVTSGMHYAWPSPSLPQLFSNSSTIHMTSGQGSWIAIIPLIGAMIGCAFAALTVDKIGRKLTIISAAIPFFAAWIIVAFANSVLLFFVARFIAGIVDGMAFSVIPLYIGEIADPKIRGFLGSNISATWILGMLLINVIGSEFTIRQAALMSSVVPLLHFATFIWMPESPYNLIMKGKFDDARKSLQIFKQRDDVEEELMRLKEAVKSQNENTGKFLDLFTGKGNRKALLILVILRNAQQFSGVAAISFYTQIIFREAGDFMSPQLATVIYVTMQFVMAFACSAVIDKTGRRPLVIVSLIGSSLCLFCLGTFFYIQTETEIDTSSIGYVPIIALVGYVIIFNFGMQPIALLIQSEIFPTNVKAFASCLSEMYFCVVASSVSKFFQIMKDNVGMYLPFLVFAVCCLVNLIFVVLMVPETKGKTLEDIQASLAEGKHKKKSQVE